MYGFPSLVSGGLFGLLYFLIDSGFTSPTVVPFSVFFTTFLKDGFSFFLAYGGGKGTDISVIDI